MLERIYYICMVIFIIISVIKLYKSDFYDELEKIITLLWIICFSIAYPIFTLYIIWIKIQDIIEKHKKRRAYYEK